MIEQHWSLAEKFIKKWFWLYLFSFIVAPMGYVIKIILSNDLTVSEVWLLYWILSLIVLVSAYHDFWITESINYFVPKFIWENSYDKVKLILTYWILLQICTWIIFALFFYFWSWYLAENYFDSVYAIQILKIFSFYFLCVNFLQIIQTFFMAIQNTFYNKIVELVRMIFTLSSVVLLFLLDYWNIITYSYAWLFWLIIWTIFSINVFYKKYYVLYLKDIKFSFDKKLVKEIIKYSLLVFLSAQATTILWQIDMQMIIFMLWTESAWYYTNYLSIIGIPFIIIWPIFWFLFPVVSELYTKNQIDKIKLLKYIFTKNFLSIWLAFNILFFVFAEIISFVFFWEKFIMSWVILKYSVLFLIFNYLLQINFQIMSWIGQVKSKLYIMLFAVVINIITNYFLINSIGVVGAALATWIGWTFIWILSEYFLWKNYFVKFDLLNFTKNLIVFSLFWLFSYYLIVPFFDDLTRIKSLLAMIIVSLLYFVIFIITNLRDIKNFILEIKLVKKNIKIN